MPRALKHERFAKSFSQSDYWFVSEMHRIDRHALFDFSLGKLRLIEPSPRGIIGVPQQVGCLMDEKPAIDGRQHSFKSGSECVQFIYQLRVIGN